MKPLDYTLYNKVKEKFPAQPFKVIFVSLKPEHLEELQGQIFSRENREDLSALIHEYGRDAIPYAAIGGFSEADVGYCFCCREFEQEEDLLTGQIIELSIGTYHNNPIDLEAVKRDLKKLDSGIGLTGNA